MPAGRPGQLPVSTAPAPDRRSAGDQSMGTKLGPNVVVAVGYNDFEDQYAGNIADALAALKAAGVKHVWWLTLRAAHHPYVTMNDDIVAAAQQHPELDGDRLERLLAQPSRVVPERRPASARTPVRGDGDAHPPAARRRRRRARRRCSVATPALPAAHRGHAVPRDARRRDGHARRTGWSLLERAPAGHPPARRAARSTARRRAQPGRYTFNVQVRDAAGSTATRRLTLRVIADRSSALPDRHVRGLLPDRAAGLVGADARQRAWRVWILARELRVLRLVELALRLPARRVDGRQPCARAWRSTARRAQRARKALLALAVGFDLGLLAYFKYTDFFLSSVDNVVGTAWLDERDAAGRRLLLHVHGDLVRRRHLPRASSCRRRSRASRSSRRSSRTSSPARSCARASCCRSSRRRAIRASVDTSRAFFLIVTGLFLKVVIANHLATHIVDDVFAAPNRHSSLEVLVAVYGYAVQIFADFCGYTNIAIGIALLLGFEFPQNFNSPYAAVSLQDFWRRWHMTLSRWLRDYLYIPLGGNRKGTARDLPQPDADDAARRAVARRGVDVRRLGRRSTASGCAIERALGWRPHTRAQHAGSAACSRSTSSVSRGSSSAPIRSRAPGR